MRLARRWGLFNAVGCGGFVLQLATLSLLTRTFGWHPAVATAIGLEIAILHNFVGHSRWTWADRPVAGNRSVIERLGRYQLAKTVSFAANLGITAALVSSAQLPLEAANTIAVLGLSAVNFLMTDALVFRQDRAALALLSAGPAPAPRTAASILHEPTCEVDTCGSSVRSSPSS